MDAMQVFCPNWDCPARGQTGKGNIGVHSRKEKRYKCRECGKTFAETVGTPFYRLRTGMEVVVLVVTLLAHGCPIRAIVAAFGLDERTVADWQARGGKQCQRVQEALVEQPRELGQVQADEIRVNTQGGVVWMALAMSVATRLWIAGVVSPHRDLKLVTTLMERVKASASALAGAILFCTDGFAAYVTAIQTVFREAVPRSERGRCALVMWPNLLIAQVVKHSTQGQLTGIVRRIVQGHPEQVEAVRFQSQGDGVINTSFIERLNATFRASLAALTRRGRSLARSSSTLHSGMYLVGTIYNFCTDHDSLRLPGLVGGRKWLARTPAMAAGITDHRWSVAELLSYRIPPPTWTPPKKRGPVSKALQTTIRRWCL